MKEDTSFYALLARMKYISRWSLMRNSTSENIQEHSHEVAVYAHALGLIRQEIFHEACDANQLAVEALFHDASEILTGDLPTPIKYHDTTLRDAYKQLEARAGEDLISMLPEALQNAYMPVLTPAAEDPLVKAADKLSALIKCIQERKAGNAEFSSAEKQTQKALKDMHLKEVDWFLEHALPSFEKNLDEIKDNAL